MMTFKFTKRHRELLGMTSQADKETSTRKRTTSVVAKTPRRSSLPPKGLEIPYGKTVFSGRTPLPPSVNEAYMVIEVSVADKVNKQGRFIPGHRTHRIGPSAKLEAYKREADHWLNGGVYFTFLDQGNLALLHRYKIALALEIKVFFKTPWLRDTSGVIKYVEDAAFKRLGLNDNLVSHIWVHRFVDRDHPHCEIVVKFDQPQEAYEQDTDSTITA